MQIKIVQSFVNAVNGKSYHQVGSVIEVPDAEALEYVAGGIAIDMTPPPVVEEKLTPNASQPDIVVEKLTPAKKAKTDEAK